MFRLSQVEITVKNSVRRAVIAQPILPASWHLVARDDPIKPWLSTASGSAKLFIGK
jgi:hypothetical protein